MGKLDFQKYYKCKFHYEKTEIIFTEILFSKVRFFLNWKSGGASETELA